MVEGVVFVEKSAVDVEPKFLDNDRFFLYVLDIECKMALVLPAYVDFASDLSFLQEAPGAVRKMNSASKCDRIHT